MFELISLAPLLLAIGSLLACFSITSRSNPYSRAIAAFICVALTVRYAFWRLTVTLPVSVTFADYLWSRVFVMGESATLLSSVLIFIFMARTRDRSKDADKHAASPLTHAPVDVFIATYNEDRAILERTIVGARSIHHEDLRVWVLDDGSREWVRELAADLGAQYAARKNGKHAKAGNINNGLTIALSGGRAPQFILLLDADFVPAKNILQRTLGLFDDSTVGIVQTPQHFFNFDPVQLGLGCTTVWPDEQRFFFESLMPCKDAWGAAFCCGTSAVLRVSALQASGGMATETVTEDMLTTFKFEEYGYRTIYLNEPLSLGLAPESLSEYVSQRCRWCLGGIQQLYTRWSFVGKGKHSWINRLAYFDSVLYWVSVSAFKLLLICAPIVFWFTGASVITASADDLLKYLGPMVAANLIFMSITSERRVLPLMTDITQMLSAFFIVRTVVSGLLRPFGRAFKVTAKGISSDRYTVQWQIMCPLLLLGCVTLAGLLINVGAFSSHRNGSGYDLNITWSLFNIFMLTASALVCVEPPKRRAQERFQSGEIAMLTDINGESAPCIVNNISLGGASLTIHGKDLNVWRPVAISFDDGTLIVAAHYLRSSGANLIVTFSSDDSQRRLLIKKLYTHTYSNAVKTVSIVKVFKRLVTVVHS